MVNPHFFKDNRILVFSIDLSLILDRHAYNNNSPPDYLLKDTDGQLSTIIPHGHQVRCNRCKNGEENVFY
jgi:hypothetical protein